jgi:hypothetical protein
MNKLLLRKIMIFVLGTWLASAFALIFVTAFGLILQFGFPPVTAQPGPQPQPFVGGTLTAPLITTAPTAGASGLNLPPGTAPSSPANGDLYVTSANIFARVAGATLPLGFPLPTRAGDIAYWNGTVWVTLPGNNSGTNVLQETAAGVPSWVSAPPATAGGSNGQIQVNVAGSLGGFTMGGDCTFVSPNVTCLKTNGTNFGAAATLGVGAGLASSGGNIILTVPVTAANGGTGVSNSTTLTLASNNGTLTFGAATNATFPAGAHTMAALDLADQTVTGGANVTSLAQSAGNITVDCGARPLQTINNGGAFTITAPASDGSCMMLVTNTGAAGAITFSGFSVGSNTGDPLTTTNTNKFTISIWRVGGTSGYRVLAHQ